MPGTGTLIVSVVVTWLSLTTASVFGVGQLVTVLMVLASFACGVEKGRSVTPAPPPLPARYPTSTSTSAKKDAVTRADRIGVLSERDMVTPFDTPWPPATTSH